MKTCKTGCGKMKAGGTVKKIKKMATGGSMIVGMPQYDNNPRTYSGRMLKEGGSATTVTNRAVKPGCRGGMVKDASGKCVMSRPKFQKGGSTYLGGPSGFTSPGSVAMRADNDARSKYYTPDNIRKEGIKLSDKEIEKKVKVAKDSLYNKYMKDAKLTPEKKSTTKKPTAKKMATGGSLKTVPADKVGLAKLPTAVRNKMGFQKKGGSVKKK